MTPPLVIIESPYAGHVALNQLYLQAALRDSLLRGEAPFASHAIYPGPLNDGDPVERLDGIERGFAWRKVASLTAVYTDLGISSGMVRGIEDANRLIDVEGMLYIDQRHDLVFRSLPGWKETGEALNEITVWCETNRVKFVIDDQGYGLYAEVQPEYPRTYCTFRLGRSGEPIHVGLQRLLAELVTVGKHE